MLPPDPVALVIGATGYVGLETVLAAAALDHVERVIAHVRPSSPGLQRLEAGTASAAGRVQIEECPLEPGALLEFLARVAPTHIFLCHGTTAKRARSEGIQDPYGTIDFGLTRLIVDAAVQLNSDPSLGPRMVYLSAMGASQGASQGAAAGTPSSYLGARGQCEDLLRASGLPHTLCRAPLITGPDRPTARPGETWGKRLLDPLLWTLGTLGMRRLASRYSSMDAAEAAEGLVRSGFHYMTINRVVLGDEFRRVGVYEKESWVPASRRDEPRF